MKKLIRGLSFLCVCLWVLGAVMGCQGKIADYSDLPGGTLTPGGTVPGGTASATSAAATENSRYKPLKITVMTDLQLLSNYAPKDTALLDYVRQKSAEYVGRDVVVEYMGAESHFSQSYMQGIQYMIATNHLPDVLVMDVTETFYNPEAIKMDNFYEITSSAIQQHMPRFTKRLEQYGINFDTVIMPMLNREQAQGTNWYIPAYAPVNMLRGLPSAFLSRMPKTPVYIQSDYHELNEIAYQEKPVPSYDYLSFRDDILKMIYPEAHTEKELTEIYRQKRGAFSVTDAVGDIPVRTLADLKDYMVKVKNLNLTYLGTPIIPVRLKNGVMDVNYFSSFTGLLKHQINHDITVDPSWFNELLVKDSYYIGDTPESGSFYYATPENRRFFEWMNDIYQAGLVSIDPINANVDPNGGRYERYAVFMPYTAIQYPNPDFGYRMLPIGMGSIDFTRNNNQYTAVDTKVRKGVFFTRKIMESDLPCVMKWLDYQMSEESDELCYWGLPDWYTGDGADRRYKPEYAGLEAWAVNGTMGDHDGYYYGLAATPAVGLITGDSYNYYYQDTDQAYLIKTVSFFQDNFCYPNAPYYVAQGESLSASQVDLPEACTDVVRYQDILPKQILYAESDDFRLSSVYKLPKVSAFVDQALKTGTADLYRSLITCKPEQFNANWSTLQKEYKNMGMDAATVAANKYVADHWQTGVLDRVIR